MSRKSRATVGYDPTKRSHRRSFFECEFEVARPGKWLPNQHGWLHRRLLFTRIGTRRQRQSISELSVSKAEHILEPLQALPQADLACLESLIADAMEDRPNKLARRTALLWMKRAADGNDSPISSAELNRLAGHEARKSFEEYRTEVRLIGDEFHEAGFRYHIDASKRSEGGFAIGFTVERLLRTVNAPIFYTAHSATDALNWLGKIRYAKGLPEPRIWHHPSFGSVLVIIPLVFLLAVFALANLFQPDPASSIVIAGIGSAFLFWIRKQRTNAPIVVGSQYLKLNALSVVHSRSRDENGDKAYLLKSYTADCPICGTKVDLAQDYPGFSPRIVGECRSNPLEHVFSFDHMTNEGRLLRR